jgi:hypothetical protein
MARKNIAATLREKRDHGDIEPKQVPYLASRILRENARELFSL